MYSVRLALFNQFALLSSFLKFSSTFNDDANNDGNNDGKDEGDDDGNNTGNSTVNDESSRLESISRVDVFELLRTKDKTSL